MDKQQKNLGFNNTNETFDLTYVNIFVGEANCTCKVTLDEFFAGYKKKFKELDDEINSKVSDKIIKNKTNEKENYSTHKIITSLAKIGMPIEVTYYIAQTASNEINRLITEKSITELSTKEVRKIVSKTIQNYGKDDYSLQDIEEWNEKYVRRYGHNNQIVKICDKSGCTDVSYKFISNVLLPDIINSISDKIDIETQIPKSQQNELAKEILDFINNCCLYRINYDVLKNMMIEIALQPPHPWFVNDKTKSNIMEYDKEQLIINLNKLQKYVNGSNSNASYQSVIIEVLHHGSSLLLAKYNQYLGVKDTTSFFLLHDIVKQLSRDAYADLVLNNCEIINVFTDVTYANIDINDFIRVMDEIADSLTSRQINISMANKVIKYGEFILRIVNTPNKENVKKTLNKKWNKNNLKEIITNVKQTLYCIAPYDKYNMNINNSFFWLKFKENILHQANCDRKNIFTYVCLDHYDEKVFQILSKYDSQSICDTVFIISETLQAAQKVKGALINKLGSNNINHYRIIMFAKEDLIKLVETSNKLKLIEDMFDDQLTAL